jgi:hypothetical protein
VTTRIRALVAALAVLGGTLTACATGPSQVNSAVIIGDRVISVDDVQHRLDRALQTEPASKELAKNRKLDLVSRGIVNQLVRHEVLAEAAKREGLTVSEKDVSDVAAGTGPAEDPFQRTVDAAFDPRETARDRVLLVMLGRKYMDRLQVVFDGALVVTPTNAQATAVDLANKMAAQPKNTAQMLNSLDSQTIQPAVDQEFSAVGAFRFFSQQQVDLAPLFGVQPNNVVAFPFGGGGEQSPSGWLVALVKKRDDHATLSEQEQSAAGTVTPQWDYQVGLQLIGPLVSELNIRISPRYGVWDRLAVGVAPSEKEKTGLLLPVATAKP